MRIISKKAGVLAATLATVLVFSSCAGVPTAGEHSENTSTTEIESTDSGSSDNGVASRASESVDSAVDFEHELGSYEPYKDHYNFYFTYKTVHPWWDAVALGMEEAQRQFLDKGVTITYEYMAPEGASAEDQTKRLYDAA